MTASDQGEITANQRVQLPPQLGGGHGVTRFMDGSGHRWGVWIPGPLNQNEVDHGYFCYVEPAQLIALGPSAESYDEVTAEVQADWEKLKAANANLIGNARVLADELIHAQAAHDRLLPVIEAAQTLRRELERVGWEGIHVSVAARFVLAVDALGTDAPVELSPADFGHVTQGDLDGIAAVTNISSEDGSFPLVDEDAADGAGTGEPPCDMDTTRGICGRPAEVRHCHGDEHGYCCVEGTYLEQLDGVAVHRMDLSRAERRRVAWRVRARYANAETQTFDHEAHALAMNELDRLKAERPGSPFDAEPAASPAGSSTADEGDGRG